MSSLEQRNNTGVTKL